MDKIATEWSDRDRADLFQETSSARGLVPAVIEKDFWVCWILGRLFAADFFKDKILFKGGTSLSKVFGLIERFSEDIDLILDWKEVTKDDPTLDRSKTKQDRFNKQTVMSSRKYLRDVFLPEMEKLLDGVCTGSISEDLPDVIKIQYPASFEETYLRPEINLEVGPLAAWIPNAEYDITPSAAEEFPDVFKQLFIRVRVISVERTFWEKATILHQESHRSEDKILPLRHSRHYYDLMLMSNSYVKEQAFRDLCLLRDVVKFKQKFYPCAWARYDLAHPGNFKLIPPKHRQKVFQNDYREMRIMIYGNVPDFREIIDALEVLEREINELHHTQNSP